jgi:hypothetical protein
MILFKAKDGASQFQKFTVNFHKFHAAFTSIFLFPRKHAPTPPIMPFDLLLNQIVEDIGWLLAFANLTASCCDKNSNIKQWRLQNDTDRGIISLIICHGTVVDVFIIDYLR